MKICSPRGEGRTMKLPTPTPLSSPPPPPRQYKKRRADRLLFDEYNVVVKPWKQGLNKSLGSWPQEVIDELRERSVGRE